MVTALIGHNLVAIPCEQSAFLLEDNVFSTYFLVRVVYDENFHLPSDPAIRPDDD
jgi:hypothetical protein